MKQNKKVASLMIGMGVLAAGAIATQQTNEAQAATTRKVAYTEGATTVWTSPEVGQKVKRYALPNQEIQFVASKKVYSQTWLQTTDGGWIPEMYLNTTAAATTTTVAKPVASTTTATSTATTTTAAPVGTVTATYQGGATTVWSDTTSLSVKSYLSEGQSASYVATKKVGSSTWYQLTNGGWVHSTYVSDGTQTTPVASTTTTATATTTTPVATTTTPVASTTQTTTPAATVTTPSTTTTTTTTTPAKVTVPTTVLGTISATYSGGATTVWSDTNTSSVKSYLGQGASASYVATKSVNGTTWYQLQNGGWVSGQYVGKPGATSSSTSTSSNSSTTVSKPTTSTPSSSSNSSSSNTVSKPVVSTPTPSKPAATNGTISSSALISYAKQFRGTPYVWGGKTPTGFDCSGFTQYVFAHFGKAIGGYTGAQEDAGTAKSVSAAKPGDLIFWGSKGSTYHVAIYIGGNQYIAAPSKGDVVKISTISSYFAPSFAMSISGVY